MGTLYIVATPIGNLEDITVRAMRILAHVDAVACEDTRRLGLLLKHIKEKYAVEIKKDQRLISYYEQNEYIRIPQLLTALRNGLDIALVSDAGTPTISDPGFKMVRAAIQEGFSVISIPGPSSVISSLVSSGLPTDKFLFLGYLPKKEGNRKKTLLGLRNVLETSDMVEPTVIILEAPHRLVKTLEELLKYFDDMVIVVAKELTKIHEEVRKEKLSTLIDRFTTRTPKGEFVLLFSLKDTARTKS